MVKVTLRDKITGQIKEVEVLIPSRYIHRMDQEMWVDNQYRDSGYTVIKIG